MDAVENPVYDEESLLRAVRAGDSRAQAILFAAHRDAALAHAQVLVHDGTEDDLVSEAFQRVFAAVAAGHGPARSFRRYLIRAVRCARLDALRRSSGRELPVGGELELQELSEIDPGPELGAAEAATALLEDAFANLPERWQAVLWRTVVEDRSIHEVASELGMSPNAMAQLSFRARNGLRLSYLTAYAASLMTSDCDRLAPDLARWAHGSLPERRRLTSIDEHLHGCGQCPEVLTLLERLEHELR